MTIVRSILLVVEVLCSVMLIGIILLQKSKGGGLGTAFGGGGGDTMFGSRTGNVLSKATIVLGLVFLLNTLVLGVMFSRRTVGQSALDKKLMQETQQEQSQPQQSSGGGEAVPANQTQSGGMNADPEADVETPVQTPSETLPAEPRNLPAQRTGGG